MAKYRKKPVVIEAWQFNGFRLGDDPSWPDWITSAIASDQFQIVSAFSHTGSACHIKTLEGTMRADPGDWIIQGVNGEIYPCKPDIFEKTYEPAYLGGPTTEQALRDLSEEMRHPAPEGFEMTPARDGLAAPPMTNVPEGYEFTEADLRSPGFVVYEPGDPQPVVDTSDIPEAGEEFFRSARLKKPGEQLNFSPDQEAAMAEMAKDAIATGIGMVEISHVPHDALLLDDAADVAEEPIDPEDRYRRFEGAIESAINANSMENASNTPDFIIAEFLTASLRALDVALQRREKWYGYRMTQLEHECASLRAQLQAEGEHTAAGSAEIDRLNSEIERITRQQQGVLAEARQREGWAP